MKIARCYRFLLIALSTIPIGSCHKWIDPSFSRSDYPEAIEKIMSDKCATAGCHNNKSFQNAGNLNLTTHQNLMKGAVNGAVIIPYSPVQSSLMQFVNTYDDLGLRGTPTMPLNAPALTREEVMTLRDWVMAGCPDRDGNIPFAANAETRRKIYISNQGCDLMSVVDAESQLVMRYVKVGKNDNTTEVPHNVRISPDGKYWYVCFIDGNFFQKYDAVTDRLLDTYEIGTGLWNIIKITSDGKKAFVSALNGKFAEVDLQTKFVKKYDGLLINPHGIALSRNDDTVYVTSQYGNMIYRLIPSLGQIDQISLQKGMPPVTTQGLLDPHEILMNSDHSKYYVTCQASNEIRVMQAGVDTLLQVIPVGGFPLEMAMAKGRHLLFVTCQEDANPNPLSKGSVYVIDMENSTVVRVIREKFYQPHGIAYDDIRQYLYVVSRNADANGPAPHHISECGNRNGFYDVIDINTWQRVRSSAEVSVDPYSADFR